MSNIDKQALRQLAVDAKELAIIKRYTKGIEAQKKFIAAMTPVLVLALLEELEAGEKRIAELEASHSNLREAMAGIHNTVSGGGAYTPLAAILNASKRAYEESAAAAGKGE